MHSVKSLSIMAVLAAVVIGLALFLVPSGDPSAPVRSLLYPSLGDRINDVKSVEIRHGDGVVSVANRDGDWVVPDSHDYPADTGAVRSLLLSLADARIVEPKTSKPALYHRLGVADVSEEDSTAVRVTLADAGGEIVASLLVGDEAGDEDRFVRRAGEAQSYRVSAVDEVPTRTVDWLQSVIVDVERADISSIEIDNGEGRIAMDAGPSGEMTLRDIPPGKQVSYQYAVNDFASTLAGLELSQVRPADGLAFGGELSATVMVAEGLQVVFETASADDATWFRFSAHTAETATEEVRVRADDMNARWEGWAYRLREADLERLSKPKSDLLEDAADGEAAPTDQAPTVDSPPAAGAASDDSGSASPQ